MSVIETNFRGSLFSRLLAKYRHHVARREAIRKLSSLPESLLQDIGIERYEIHDAISADISQFEAKAQHSRSESTVKQLRRIA